MPASLYPRQKDNGATFLGSLIALAIILIALSAVFPFLTSAVGSINRTIRSARSSYVLARFDSVLRKTVERIRPPFWIDYAVTQETDGITFPFYNGSLERHLSVMVSGDLVRIETDDFTWSALNTGIQEVSPLTDGNGAIRGITLQGIQANNLISIEAVFGASPFRSVVKP